MVYGGLIEEGMESEARKLRDSEADFGAELRPISGSCWKAENERVREH